MLRAYFPSKLAGSISVTLRSISEAVGSVSEAVGSAPLDGTVVNNISNNYRIIFHIITKFDLKILSFVGSINCRRFVMSFAIIENLSYRFNIYFDFPQEIIRNVQFIITSKQINANKFQENHWYSTDIARPFLYININSTCRLFSFIFYRILYSI